MENIHLRSSQLMDTERNNNTQSLRSKIALVVPTAGAAVSEADGQFAEQTLRVIRENIPDARIIFMAGGTTNRFDRFVLDSRRDIFPLRTAIQDNGIPVQVNAVVARVLEGTLPMNILLVWLITHNLLSPSPSAPSHREPPLWRQLAVGLCGQQPGERLCGAHGRQLLPPAPQLLLPAHG